MKKIISVLMTSLFLMTYMTIILPSSVYAEIYEVTTENGDVITKFWYEVIDGYAEIVEMRIYDDIDELIFPAEIDGYPVKVIQKATSFDGAKKQLKSITFEEGIEEINLSCSKCPNLIDIHLPDTLKSGNFSLWHCQSLENITIPGSLEQIPDACFRECENLKNVTIENGVKVIGKQAFEGCTSLTSIVIPDSVYNIDDYAFNICSNLKDITLSKNLEYISDYAFYKTGIEQIKLPSGLKEIGEQAFAFTPLKEIKLPDSLESIGYETFKLCKSLTKAYIPKGIMDKPNKAFYACDNLSDVSFDGEITKELYDHLTAETAWGKEYQKTVTDDFVIFDGNYLAAYNGTDKNPVIPDNVTVLSEQAFQNADIYTVTFSPNIEIIPSMCFAGSHIKELVIPSTVKKVEERAFYRCLELEKISVEDGVESIANNAFQMCRELSEENINIGKSVSVSSTAFSDTPLGEKAIESGQFATPIPTVTPTVTPIKENEKLTVTSDNNNINISVNSENVIFPDTQPFVDNNDRTQVPVRAVSEMLGCKVDWNGENKTATIARENGDIIKLTLGSDIMTINDKSVQMDTSAIIKDDRTYIPVRFVAEALGLTVEWVQ